MRLFKVKFKKNIKKWSSREDGKNRGLGAEPSCARATSVRPPSCTLGSVPVPMCPDTSHLLDPNLQPALYPYSVPEKSEKKDSHCLSVS